jgi:murein DD-endopeptidase MepM/ murein hydrolase activator NlpD
MMIRTALLGFLLLGLQQNIPTIDKDKDRWKPYYADVVPVKTINGWFLPFETTNRKDIRQVKVISIFGDHRDSFFKGHIHTAIDMNPASPKGKYVEVYPIASGTVCSVHLGENQRTVVVKHRLPDGKIIFSSYKHLKEVYVKNGQQLDEHTKIARLFTPQESKKYGGDYHHLHLEIRKNFDDYGCASWLTMNKSQLDLRFYNPLSFLKEHLKS